MQKSGVVIIEVQDGKNWSKVNTEKCSALLDISLQRRVRQYGIDIVFNFDQFSEPYSSILAVVALRTSDERRRRGRLGSEPFMPEKLIILLLAVWVGATAVLVHTDCAEKFLWIPVLLALAGVFSSMLPVAASPDVAAVANGAILLLFIVSFGVLEKNHRFPIELMRHRA